MAVDHGLRHRRGRQAVQIEPLLHQLIGIGRVHGAVGAAVPHRELRPRSLMRRGVAHAVAEMMRGVRRRPHHRMQRLPHIVGHAVRQPGDHRAAGEHIRIGRQHHRAHRAAGGQAGDEDLLAVDAMGANHLLDHGADRGGLAAAALNVAGLEPVEAEPGIVGLGLLRHQQRKTIASRQRRPAGADLIARRGLGAAVQHHHQAGLGRQVRRDIGPHPQLARIAAERDGFDQPAGAGRRGGVSVQPIGSVELSQLRRNSRLLARDKGRLLIVGGSIPAI